MRKFSEKNNGKYKQYLKIQTTELATHSLLETYQLINDHYQVLRGGVLEERLSQLLQILRQIDNSQKASNCSSSYKGLSLEHSSIMGVELP